MTTYQIAFTTLSFIILSNASRLLQQEQCTTYEFGAGAESFCCPTTATCAAESDFKEPNPVQCGTTYPNQCVSQCDYNRKTAKRFGFCQVPYGPVCCGVDRQYDNSCSAELAADITDASTQCKSGVCSNFGFCQLQFEPVCCYGKDFPSKCAANLNAFVNNADNECVLGTCADNGLCLCADTYEPLCCGSVGNNFAVNNQCGAQQATLTCKPGNCPFCIIPFIFKPVCCNDGNGNGIQFSNSQAAECDVFIDDIASQCVDYACPTECQTKHECDASATDCKKNTSYCQFMGLTGSDCPKVCWYN
eukprot:267541_1